MGPTNSGSWGNPVAQTSPGLRVQPQWNMRPMAQTQNEPGLMPQAQQQPDVADFMKRYYGWGATQGFSKMQ